MTNFIMSYERKEAIFAAVKSAIKQIDREYGAAEIKNMQKLTAALWTSSAICGGLLA